MNWQVPNRLRHRSAAALVAAALLLSGAGRPQDPPLTAIACTGSARFTDNSTGRESVRKYDLPRQVYVLDEAGRRVQRALKPRQEFEDVCFTDGYINSVDFSPGLITVRSEKAGAICDFSVSRATGKGQYFSQADLGGARFSRIEFSMNCDRTEIPVFDSSRNRF